MWAFQPQDLNWASMNSALALSWGEPTWFGREAICSIQADISLGSSWASKTRSAAASSICRPAVMPGGGGREGEGQDRRRRRADVRSESLRTVVIGKTALPGAPA